MKKWKLQSLMFTLVAILGLSGCAGEETGIFTLKSRLQGNWLQVGIQYELDGQKIETTLTDQDGRIYRFKDSRLGVLDIEEKIQYCPTQGREFMIRDEKFLVLMKNDECGLRQFEIQSIDDNTLVLIQKNDEVAEGKFADTTLTFNRISVEEAAEIEKNTTAINL